MKQKINWIAFVWLLFGSPLFAQQAGMYIHTAYSKPFCNNQYLGVNGKAGISLGVGLFNQINDHLELDFQLGINSVDFENMRVYSYSSYSSLGGYKDGAYDNVPISLVNTNLESQVRYYILDRRLGFGFGFFGAQSNGNQIASGFTYVSNENMEGYQPHEVNSVELNFPDDMAFGALGIIIYEPAPQIQFFIRYDNTFTNILPNETETLIGKSRYGMFKTGIEIRLIRDFTKRRY